MPSLASLIPSRFARACATEGFVPECLDALKQLAGAPNAAAAVSILGGVAGGPAAFIALYAGASLVQWKKGAKKENDDKAWRDQISRALARIEMLHRDSAEVQQIDRELEGLLRSDPDLQALFANIEVTNDADATEAIKNVVRGVYVELGIEGSFEGVRIYLSNISDWIGEIRETTREIDRKQDKQLENQDKQLENDDEMLRRLDEIDQRLKAFGENAPGFSEEDKRILAEARAHGNAKAQAQAAIMQRDFAAADPLIKAVTQRAAGELFDALTLKGDRHYYAGEYDDAIEPYEKALELRPDDITARNNAALTHNDARLWSIEAHNKRAIEIFLGTLDLVHRGTREWAVMQNNLGTAYANLPTGDRAENLANAIMAYKAALTVYTREAHPADWAMTQNNLGSAYAKLPTRDRSKNLTNAISAFESALTVYTREAHPADWAMTQNNLGSAYAKLLTGDRPENLANAISVYEAALTVYTPEAHPSDWATTHPSDWATTQHNLAIALASLAEEQGQERCGLLRRAVASGKGALTVFTAEAYPREHEMTARNLDIDRTTYESAGCSPLFDEIPPAE